MKSQATIVEGPYQLPCPELTARRATRADLPGIWLLLGRIYSEPQFNDASRGFHVMDVRRWYEQDTSRYTTEFWGPDRKRRFAVVLEDPEGYIVGVGVLITCPGNDGVVDETVGEITKVYLDEQFRKHGVGRWLMDVLLEKARELGFEHLVLMTRVEFEDALSLYEQFGFEEVKNHKYSFEPNSIQLELDL